MSIYKRYNGKKLKSAKDPNWDKGTFYIYKRIHGQVIHKSIPEAQTVEQARQAERKIIEKIFSRRYGSVNDTTTFAQFVDKTYSKYVKQNNVNIYVKEIFIKELKKFFGRKLLSDITAQDCRDYQYKRLHTKTRHDTKRSTSSVNKEMSTLSKIFNLACQEEILERNPMQYVKKLEEPKKRNRLLSSEEKENLWRELEKDKFLYRIVKLATNLPLRRAQLLAITKESINFDKKILLAVASKGREARIVPLNDTAISILRELCREVDSGVLLRINGKPVKEFKKRWHTALLNAGINKENDTRENNFHFHDLRREFATELVRNNNNPLVIQELFAHSDMSITSIYTEVDLEAMFKAVNSLDKDVLESEVIDDE